MTVIFATALLPYDMFETYHSVVEYKGDISLFHIMNTLPNEIENLINAYAHSIDYSHVIDELTITGYCVDENCQSEQYNNNLVYMDSIWCYQCYIRNTPYHLRMCSVICDCDNSETWYMTIPYITILPA